MPDSASTRTRAGADIRSVLASERGRGRAGRVLLWLGIAALAALVVLAYAYSRDGEAVAYVTEPVTRGGLVVTVTATGSVQPTKKVDVSSELSGTVRSVLVDFNSTVIAGQVLAELDTDRLKATVERSRARLAAARARVIDAAATRTERESDLARRRALANRQVASTQDLEQAQAAFDRAVAAVAIAGADVAVAEADLRLDESNLAKTCICSPIDGVVLRRNVDPGQTVASSFQAPVLFSIAQDLRRMELQVDVDEADVGQVRQGQSATFTVDAFPERRFPATIRDVRFAAETIQGVVTYKAVLDIDNAELLLRPGMTATAEIMVNEVHDALLVPNAALRYAPPAAPARANQSLLSRLLPGRPRFGPVSRPDETGRERTVWTLAEGVPAPVRVTVGASDGRRTEMAAGALAVGQALVVDQNGQR